MQYAVALAMINRDRSVALRLRRYFHMRRDANVGAELRRLHLCQADLVLALLRLGDLSSRDHIANIIGHPITVCPPHRRANPITKNEKKLRVLWVVPTNPRHPNTGAFDRFQLLRPGRSIDECMMRGATPRDIRSAIRNGWIHVNKESK